MLYLIIFALSILALYNWYLQAVTVVKGKYSIRHIVYALIISSVLILLGLYDQPNFLMNVILALILVIGFINGSNGVSKKWLTLSIGRKRRLKLDSIKNVDLIILDGDESDSTICCFYDQDDNPYLMNLLGTEREVKERLLKLLNVPINVKTGLL
ncbi:MAG: hypothetical protein Q3960_04115 [Lactobacillus sp.]|nr:hypothetical protein [Lactobacillus sp.]